MTLRKRPDEGQSHAWLENQTTPAPTPGTTYCRATVEADVSPEECVVGDTEIRGNVEESAKDGVPVFSFETQQSTTWGHVGLQVVRLVQRLLRD